MSLSFAQGKSGAGVSGQRTDGAAEEARLLALGDRVLPPYPGSSLVPLARVPAPPLLSDAQTEIEHVQRLGLLWRNALSHRIGRSSYFMVKGRDTAGQRTLLMRAAAMMRTSAIPPAAWILWNLDWWLSEPRRPKVPTPGFVFSPNRLEKHGPWFHDEKLAYMGGAIRPGPQHLRLIADWGAMWGCLLRERPETRDTLAAAVERFFPGDDYDVRLRAATVEARAIQRQMDALVQAGGIIW